MLSTTSATNTQTQNWLWTAMVPYAAPPLSASLAITVTFKDMIAKSALQKGQPVPFMTFLESLRLGAKAAPTVGVIVGSQIALQGFLEKALLRESKSANLTTTLMSSAIVGMASAPILAVFNGQTMGLTLRESLKKFTLKQSLAISFQETSFVAGLSVADKLASSMKQRFGNSKAVDYSAAFVAGAMGSLAGHPANTALTRWQNGMPLTSFQQSMWGAARKARAVGCFSLVYKAGNEFLNSF